MGSISLGRSIDDGLMQGGVGFRGAGDGGLVREGSGEGWVWTGYGRVWKE